MNLDFCEVKILKFRGNEYVQNIQGYAYKERIVNLKIITSSKRYMMVGDDKNIN